MYFSVHVMAHLSSLFLICNVVALEKGLFSCRYNLFGSKVPNALIEANLGHRIVNLGEFPELANLLRIHIIGRLTKYIIA